MSEKIQPQHLARKAMLYVRQSSAFQVINNQESSKLQYAMQARLHALGFSEIEVIDEDLGRSAAGTVCRSGFERMVAEVSLGRVGAVAAREVSRFARNSREWQQLVEVCRIVDTVLVDHETVYAPRAGNDRLLLGLKGSLNEYELDLLRQRSLEARRAMARRGELLIIAPVGFRKGEDQRFEKDPDRRVQEAIRLVFDQFERIGSVRQTLLWFHEHGLQLPAAAPRAEIRWKRPAYGTVYQILTNPIYGGAYAYGKTERGTRYVAGEARHIDRRMPRDQWFSLIPNTHEGYVDWERFERIQHAIHANRQIAAGHHGPARAGSAVMAGLLRCRRCAAKLTVHYTGSLHDVARYACHRAWLDKGQPRCISFGGKRVDESIAAEVLRIVQPAAIEAATLAYRDEANKQDEVRGALERDLQAARYAASRAERQFDASDPENRLVTAELERRWNQALDRVREIEQRISQHHGQQQPEQPSPTIEEFSALAERLEELWQCADTDVRLRKRIVRSLIHEVIVDVDAASSEIVLVIHWKGGLHSEVRVPRRRRGQNSTHTAPATLDAVRSLARICSDTLIANLLNRNALRTGRGNFWTRERVTALRSHHEIPVYNPEQRADNDWINLTEAARFLRIAPKTLRIAVERGEIAADHPLPDGPWIFKRTDLQTGMAAAIGARAREHYQRPAVPNSQQSNLDLSMT
jgi:DNA invertase Pin-like site-specific DNA recombinase